MYDIYKGNQDDYFMCTIPFDVSDQAFVVAEFDCWVEGQWDIWDYYTPYDYLDFEVWDLGDWYNPYGLTLYDHDNPTEPFEYPNYVWNWMDFQNSAGYLLGGAMYFMDTTMDPYDYFIGCDYLQSIVDLGGGWWHVTCTLPIGWFYDPTEVYFRFSWHSDPQFQYEGAYVDNFKVISLEEIEEKIFQTHSQGPIEWEVEIPYYFEFPLTWGTEQCPIEEGCYTILVWLENHDGESFNDWPYYVEIDFCVGDEIDCEITDLLVEDSFTQEIVPDEGRMTKGADAHIVFDYHNNGNVPVEDVAITASAFKKTWETVYSTDFEGMVWAETGAFYSNANGMQSPDLWTKVSFDSWSGSSCLGCLNKDTMHYENGLYVNYVVGPIIDMENVEEAYMDYYVKYITADAADRMIVNLRDPACNFVLGCGASMTGFHPQWEGPMQPLGTYAPFNLKAYYDFWIAAYGLFTNPDGSQSYDCGIGFRTYSDMMDYTNDYAEEMGVYWSGWLVDDVSVRVLSIAEEPTWTDTLIIPGPIEPCDTYHAQFEWEDVDYSMYRICVEAVCEGDIDEDNNELCQDIIVVDDLEYATDPKVESHDYTGSEGCWGLCGSDYDWYLSTNPDSEWYEWDLDCTAVLCPEGESCIDITHLWPSGPVGVPTSIFLEDFELGIIPFGWTTVNLGTGVGWFIDFYGSGTFEEPSTGTGAFYACIDSDDSGMGVHDTGILTSPPIDLTAGGTATGTVDIEFDVGWNCMAGGPDFGYVQILDLGVPYQILKVYDFSNDPTNQHEILTFDPSGMIDPTTAQIEFFYDDMNTWAWNLAVDNVEVIAYVGGAPPTLPLVIEFDRWCDIEYGWDFVLLEVVDGCPEEGHETVPDDWQIVWLITGNEYDTGGWQHEVVDLAPYITGNEFMLRFRFISDDWHYSEYRGFLLDNVFIADLFDVTQITDPVPVFEDFFDDFSTEDDICVGDDSNWCLDMSFGAGQYWEYVPDNEWCNTFPAYGLKDGLIWDTEILMHMKHTSTSSTITTLQLIHMEQLDMLKSVLMAEQTGIY
jgi:hypothetical protein